jgi:hypothetical protein
MANPMPSPAESSQLDFYATVEAAYRNGDWNTVLEQGTVLNRRLARASGANVQALRQRLEMMLAHTHLYGFGNAESAQRHYQALLIQPVEASLRQMAEDGLKQCSDRIAAAAEGSGDRETATAELSERETSQRADQPSGSEREGSTAAEPWLNDLNANRATADNATPQPTIPTGETSNPSPRPRAGMAAATNGVAPGATLIPEVIDEPELLELHQADPSLADEIELNPQPILENQPLASLAEAAQAEIIAAEAGFGVEAAPVAEEPDPDLLACLRLVRLS